MPGEKYWVEKLFITAGLGVMVGCTNQSCKCSAVSITAEVKSKSDHIPDTSQGWVDEVVHDLGELLLDQTSSETINEAVSSG